MLLLKRLMLIYIVLIVSGSLQRRKGRPPVCCIYICTAVCNGCKSEHTFLTRQNVQLNCVSFLATLTRAQLACNSSRTNCLVIVFTVVFIYSDTFSSSLETRLQEIALDISFRGKYCHSELRPQGNTGLLLERMHAVNNFVYLFIYCLDFKTLFVALL